MISRTTGWFESEELVYVGEGSDDDEWYNNSAADDVLLERDIVFNNYPIINNNVRAYINIYNSLSKGNDVYNKLKKTKNELFLYYP